MCLVFFGSPGAIFESLTFQPDIDTAALTWTGQVGVPTRKPTTKKRRTPQNKLRRR